MSVRAPKGQGHEASGQNPTPRGQGLGARTCLFDEVHPLEVGRVPGPLQVVLVRGQDGVAHAKEPPGVPLRGGGPRGAHERAVDPAPLQRPQEERGAQDRPRPDESYLHGW